MTETKEDFFKWPPVPGQYRSPDGHVGIGARSHARLADVRSVADWIRLNEAALVDYWEYRISAVQFYPAIATLDVKRNTAAVVCTQRNGTPPGGAWKIRPRIVRSRHAKILNSSEAAKHY